MDRSDVIKLISEIKKGRDKYGRPIKEPNRRQVYVQVDSISMNEFYEAGRNGLNPQFRFRMFAGDYEGERACEYKGNDYAIYRTFMRDDDTIELYVERKGGTNNAESNAEQSGHGDLGHSE